MDLGIRQNNSDELHTTGAGDGGFLSVFAVQKGFCGLAADLMQKKKKKHRSGTAVVIKVGTAGDRVSKKRKTS